MDYKDIKALLDQYFEGQTSVEQERQLKAYFQQEEIPAEFEPFRPLFQFFSFEQEQELGQDFDTKVLQQLQLEAKPQTTLRRLVPYMSRIAAAIVLAVGLTWVAYQYVLPEEPPKQAIDWSKYEPKTPEEALQITRAALHKASSKLNNGASQAAQKFSKIEEISKFFK